MHGCPWQEEEAHGSETRTNSKSTQDYNLDARYKTIFDLRIITVSRWKDPFGLGIVLYIQCCGHYINLYIAASHTSCVVTVHHHIVQTKFRPNLSLTSLRNTNNPGKRN